MIDIDLLHFNRYFAEAKRQPHLEPDEERALFIRLQKNPDDSNAVDQLVKSHLRLVAGIAAHYKGYGLPLSELVSSGHIGLMKAVSGFSLDHGARFNTYARQLVRSYIRKHVRNNWSIVKIGSSKAQKKLFFKLRELKQTMGASGNDLNHEQVVRIANHLDVPAADVVLMNLRFSARDVPIEDEEPHSQNRLVDWKTSQDIVGEQQERKWGRKKIKEALEKLSPPQDYVFRARYLRDPPMTFGDIAGQDNFIKLTPSQRRVSNARVEQYANHAFHIVAHDLARAAEKDGLDIAPSLKAVLAVERMTFRDLYESSDAGKFGEVVENKLNKTEQEVVKALCLNSPADPSQSYAKAGRELCLSGEEIEKIAGQATERLKRALLPQAAREVSAQKLLGLRKPCAPRDERNTPASSSTSAPSL